ncbi:MAG: hypothetical protein ABJH94_12245 [Paracoccaceae bacterium]
MGLKRTDEFRKDAVRIALTSGLKRKQVARKASRPFAVPGVVASGPDRTGPEAEDQTRCTVCAEPAGPGAGSSAGSHPSDTS